MNTTSEQHQYAFQAEIKQLLHLLSHSLYQNREIAIRELVSNASDALDKMRHISLTEEAYRTEESLEIHLDPNADERVLTIRDNGIGMSHDELVENLGTIAHSGSLEFLNKLSGDANADLSLIGQFGVGFYSAFMLADRVEVLTRSYREEDGWRWESEGTGTFSIEPAESLPRGTQVRLHLKKEFEEFTDSTRLKHVLQTYSTFVPHPIKLNEEHVNNQSPIWVEPKSQLTEEQYVNFYQYLTHRTEEKPLWHLHLSSDSPFQFHAILYCPASNFESLGFGRTEHGLHLCAKRILVQNDCRALLPEYLRFLYGLVDSADLPLNVSRESLQDNTVFRKIRRVLVKRVLDHLKTLAEENPDDYLKFYMQFGSILREGIGTDFDNREKIAQLLRFQSSALDDPEQRTSLDAYLSRAPEEQKQIYYVGGPDLSTLRKNPNLEIFRKKKLEVLYVADPVDEVVLTSLGQFEERPIVSIDAADVELPPDAQDADKQDDEQQKQESAPPAGFERVLELFREALGADVEEVRKSDRLTDSPCCLVNPQGSMSTQLQKMLKMANQDFEMSRRILEINPQSALIQRLSQLTANSAHDDFVKDCGRQLFSNAMILEGMMPDGEAMVSRVQQFMQELADNRSPIVT